MNTYKILLVEDEHHLGVGLKLNFELEGYHTQLAHTGREAIRALTTTGPFHLIILDITLPDMDGFQFCQQLRLAEDHTPILMLTARNHAEDRVKGLEVGADDYLTKPFDLDELMARIRSLLRRQAWNARTSVDKFSVFTFGEAVVDFERYEARMAGKNVQLTALEFSLLRYFSTHPNRTLSRQELLEQVWELQNYPNTRTIDNFVMRLRRNFEPKPSSPRYIISVRGVGYKFIP
jgi:DNA-binding response OmpR family regulator